MVSGVLLRGAVVAEVAAKRHMKFSEVQRRLRNMNRKCIYSTPELAAKPVQAYTVSEDNHFVSAPCVRVT